MTSIPSSRACYSAICRTSSGTWSIRARATAGCRFSLNASRASAHFQSTPVTSFERAIAAFLPLRCQLAGRFERSGPVFGARLPAIFSRIRRDIRPGLLNFCRPLVAAGKPSFLPLVQACKQASGSFFHGFQVSPGGFPFDAHLARSAGSSGLVAVSDGHRDSERKIGNVRKSSGEIRNVIR